MPGVGRLTARKLMERIRTSPTSDYRRVKRRVLLTSAAFAFLLGPFWVLYDEGSLQSRLVDLAMILGSGLLILGWCYYDSLERGRSLGTGFRLLVVLLGVFALFIYLLRSRGFGRGLRSIGLALLVYVGAALVAALSATAFGLAFGFI